jgi:hypothetical protein
LVEPRVSGTDANAAAEFLSELFRYSQSLVFIISKSESGEVPAGNIAPHIFTREKDRMREFTREWDQPGREVFFCATTVKIVGPFKIEFSELVALHACLDLKNIAARRKRIERAIEALPLRPQFVVFSGHGFHCYWLLQEPLPFTGKNIARVEAALHKLADVLAGDPSACKCTRRMRLPGSHNTMAGSSLPVEIVQQRPGRYCLERIEAWLATAYPVLHHTKAYLDDLWAENDQLRRWAEAEEADDDGLWAEIDRY